MTRYPQGQEVWRAGRLCGDARAIGVIAPRSRVQKSWMEERTMVGGAKEALLSLRRRTTSQSGSIYVLRMLDNQSILTNTLITSRILSLS